MCKTEDEELYIKEKQLMLHMHNIYSCFNIIASKSKVEMPGLALRTVTWNEWVRSCARSVQCFTSHTTNNGSKKEQH